MFDIHHLAHPNNCFGFTQNKDLNDVACFSKTTDEEPNQQLDLIGFLPQPEVKFRVEHDDMKLVFTEPLKGEDGEIIRVKSYGYLDEEDEDKRRNRLFLSDHFGAYATIRILD